MKSYEPFKIFSKTATEHHDIYLSDSIKSKSVNYIHLLKFLNEVGEGDTVKLHLANFGGACHTGLRIAHALKNCDAKTLVQVDAPCYSMGAILAVCGNLVDMMPGTFLMFHNYSTTESGKAGEVASAVKEYEKHYYYSLQYLCYPFLTKQEIQKLRKDEDVYIHYNDKTLDSRIVKHFLEDNPDVK